MFEAIWNCEEPDSVRRKRNTADSFRPVPANVAGWSVTRRIRLCQRHDSNWF